MLRSLATILFIWTLVFNSSFAQCDAYDGNGNITPTPQWLSCFGVDYTLNFQSPNDFGAYTIDWGDGTPIENGASYTTPAIISHLYPVAVETYTVTFTEIATGCTIIGSLTMEEPTTASIQIPFGGITQTCAPAPLEFINSSTNTSPNTVFTWDFGDGSPPLVVDYTNAGDTVVHTYLQGTVDCETFVSLTSENVCNTEQGGPSIATFNPIRIWDLDEPAIDASDVLLCFPETEVTFQNATDRNCLPQGNTFQRQEYWNFGDYWGLGYDSIVDWTPWPPANPYTIDYPGIGTYDVTLIDSNFCGQIDVTITVEIVPPPTAALSLSDDTICVDELFNALNLSTGGGNQLQWNFGDGTGWQVLGNNPTHSYIAPGDYTVHLVTSIAGANGCTDTVSLPIHVLPIPQSNFVLDNNNGCDLLSVTFTDASVDAIDWDWNFGNGNVHNGQTPPTQNYITGIYSVSLEVTASNGCIDQTGSLVNVYESPIVAFIPTSVCENTLASFQDQSTSAAGDPIVSWNWDFGNGLNSALQNPTTTYTSNGNFAIDLTVSTAHCSNNDIVSVTVEPEPTADFNQDLNQGCPNLLVNFSNNSVGAISYDWNFGDGNSDNNVNPSNVFSNNFGFDTTYTVELIAYTAFGCSDTSYSSVEVFYSVNADFIHDGIPGCAPLDVNFTNTSTIGQTYEWDFGDGNTDLNYNTSHQYINLSQFINNYEVELVVISPNGCTDTNSQFITVYPLPDFSFTSVPDSGCSPLTVNFPSVVGAVAYDWDFGDGSTGSGPSPSHLYTNATTNDVIYNVELIATSPFGCEDTNYATVKVFPNPTSQFSVIQNSGCAPFYAEFQNTSLGAVTYEWLYDDGQQSDTLIGSHEHLYFNNGTINQTFEPQLIAFTDRGCPDTSSQFLTVFPELIAQFDVDTAGCSPFHAFFTDQSINATDWDWDFDNGFTDVVPNPNEFFFNNTNNDLVFNVELIASNLNGCSDTVFQEILVYPLPNSNFTATPVTQTYPDATIGFNNASSLGSWNYIWDFADGNGSSDFTPSDYTYATWGDYEVELIVASAFCSDTSTQTITIIPPLPIPEVYGSGEGCRPVTIQFSDSSEYVDSYYWDFGDGGFSTLPNPYYTYHQAGEYTINLTVTGPGGVQTLIIEDSVLVHEYANAFFQNAPTNVYVPSEPVQFYNLSSYANQYQWDFGDGNTSNEEEPEYFYTAEGSYTVTLIANNENNCPDTVVVPLAVIAETGGEIQFPNAFTPNTNGPNGGYYDPQAVDNDIFFPVFVGVEEYELNIFNRWGELIFETFDKNQGWDGYYRDQLSQQDVYIWKAIIKFTNGNEETFVGEVHLIR